MAPLILIALIAMAGEAMALEEPHYEVLETGAEYELRRYAPYLVAEVDVDGDYGEAGGKAFRILAGYIFGDNLVSEKMQMTAPVESTEKSVKMAMTAPVTSTAASGSEGMLTFAFVMERKYTRETLPVPRDSRIRIVERPGRTMAAHTYSGRWTANNDRNHRETLQRALARDAVETVGEPVFARYNAPFVPWFLRRNEVLIEVRQDREGKQVN